MSEMSRVWQPELFWIDKLFGDTYKLVRALQKNIIDLMLGNILLQKTT